MGNSTARQMGQYVRHFLFLAALTLIAACSQPQETLAAPYAAYVMDARTGETLYSENADTRLHPASLTKMMTLYITFSEIEAGNVSLDTMITVSKNAAAQPPSRLENHVWEAMIKLAEKYFDRPAAELPLLFQRILSNCTLDWFRRQKTQKALFSTMSDFESPGEDEGFDLLETLHAASNGEQNESAETQTERAQTLHEIEVEVLQLPARQREAFLMRYWEEMDVAETAASMGCSEGSVKTHCSRAVHSLSTALKGKGISL